jgi:tetratricopeptide (TPR) repeat protein
LNRNQEAIQEYQIALKQKPDHGLSYLGLADVYYYNTKQYNEAAAAYRQGLRLRPGSATSNFNLGWCLNDLEQYSEAMTVLRESIRIKAQYPEAHNELGYALQQLNRYPEAVQEYSIAISQRNEYALAHYNLGATYVAMGNRNGALQQYRILQRIDPSSATKLANLIK